MMLQKGVIGFAEDRKIKAMKMGKTLGSGFFRENLK